MVDSLPTPWLAVRAAPAPVVPWLLSLLSTSGAREAVDLYASHGICVRCAAIQLPDSLALFLRGLR